MRQSIAAFFAHALGPVKDLFSPARGRHSAAARRRRSTRVRPYAPAPATAALQVSTPRLAPPSVHLRADDIPCVRPYFAAREAELSTVQSQATARLHAWAAKTAKTPPAGDLLAAPVPPQPGEFDELAALVRTWQSQQRREVAA